jgi:hypothetical protein
MLRRVLVARLFLYFLERDFFRLLLPPLLFKFNSLNSRTTASAAESGGAAAATGEAKDRILIIAAALF